jgi:hypothetical protein
VVNRRGRRCSSALLSPAAVSPFGDLAGVDTYIPKPEQF